MKDKTSDSSNIVDRVWRLFTSMRLALFLIFLLAILSVVGTLIPQGRGESFYLTTYGANLSHWFVRLDIPDMYHSWWFSLLLAIFALNIIVCTIERFPPKWSLFKRGERDMDLTHIKELPQYNRLDLGNTSASALSRSVKSVLRSRAYRVSEMVSSDLSIISLKGHKGRLNRFGSDIVHFGIIVILLGGIIGSITGFKEYKPIPVGETVKIDSVDFDLHIRANKFWIENYESGEVKQYYSDLNIIDNGQEVLQNGLLYVNKP
ncbi:MAG: cytochrome c biogenesis protein ResB, partial [Nitrospinota bacterium]